MMQHQGEGDSLGARVEPEAGGSGQASGGLPFLDQRKGIGAGVLQGGPREGGGENGARPSKAADAVLFGPGVLWLWLSLSYFLLVGAGVWWASGAGCCVLFGPE